MKKFSLMLIISILLVELSFSQCGATVILSSNPPQEVDWCDYVGHNHANQTQKSMGLSLDSLYFKDTTLHVPRLGLNIRDSYFHGPALSLDGYGYILSRTIDYDDSAMAKRYLVLFSYLGSDNRNVLKYMTCDNSKILIDYINKEAKDPTFQIILCVKYNTDDAVNFEKLNIPIFYKFKE